MNALRQRLDRWLEASIGNRFNAVLLTLMLGLMIVAGSVNFAYLLHLTKQTAQASLAEANRDAANFLERTLQGVEEDVRLLAANPTVGSAVLDVRDQETYLHPLLARQRPHGRTPLSLCVTDYRGRSLGCSSQHPRSFAGQAWLDQAIGQARPLAHVSLDARNEPLLHIAYPIAYEGTGGAEGAVVAEYDLAGLLLDAIGSNARFDEVHLTSKGRTLYFNGRHDDVTHVARPVVGGPSLAALELHLYLGISDAAYNAPVLKLMAAYGLMALLLVAVAFWAARRAVPPLIARLTAITAEANRVAVGESADFTLDAAGDDEVAQLARSFATMTRRLKATNASLEAQVEARTAELRRQENLLQSVIDAVPGIIFQYRQHPDGKFSVPFVSHSIDGVHGVTSSEVFSDARPAFSHVHPDDIEALLAALRESARTLSLWQQDFRVVRPDGSVVWLQGNAKPRREPDGAVLWHGILTDITEHKQAELALADSEAYTKALFKTSYIPLVIMHPATGVFLDCNDAAVAIFGLGSRDEVVGKTPWDVAPPTQYDDTPSQAAGLGHIAAARSEGLHVFEWRHRRPNGEVWDAEVRLMKFRLRGSELLQFSLRDITDQKRSEAESWRRANFDALTGLANRSLCLDRLRHALAQARRSGRKVGVLFIDLDGFKGINDTLGHAAGDQLLVEAARRLEGCVREQDTVARFGGDEFVLVAQDLATSDDLCRIAEHVVGVLQDPIVLGGSARRISGSVGIAVYPDHADAAEELLSLADAALYRCKRAGKNGYALHDGPSTCHREAAP